MRHDLDDNWRVTEHDRWVFDTRLRRLGGFLAVVVLLALAARAQW